MTTLSILSQERSRLNVFQKYFKRVEIVSNPSDLKSKTDVLIAFEDSVSYLDFDKQQQNFKGFNHKFYVPNVTRYGWIIRS